MTKIFLTSFLLLLVSTVAQAQDVHQGVVTDTRFGKQSGITYSVTQRLDSSVYATVYSIVNPEKNLPLRAAIVTFDTTTRRISVVMHRLVGNDTVVDRRAFQYRDTFGLVFTPRRALLDIPAVEPVPLFAFESDEKRYLRILTVDETGKGAERRYRLDELAPEMVEVNVQYLATLGAGPVAPVPLARPGTRTADTAKTSSAPAPTLREPSQPSNPQPQVLTPTQPQSRASRSQYNATIDSIETVVRPSSREMIDICILFHGGVSNYDANRQGIEWVALNTAVYGATRTAGADRMAQLFARANLRIRLDFAHDHTRLSCSFPLAAWDDAWKLLGDVLLRSAFSLDDFEAARAELLSSGGATAPMIMPAAFEAGVRDAFASRQLDKSPFGTVQSLSSLPYEETRRFFQSLVARNRIALAVTGNVTVDMVRRKIKAEWKGMPLGSVTAYNPQPFDPATSQFKVLPDLPSPVNVITLIAPGSKPFTPDMVASEIGLQLLERRLNDVLVAQRRVASRVGVYAVRSAQPLTVIQFVSDDPDKAMQALLDELKRIKRLGVTDEELALAKQEWITDFFFALSEQSRLAETLAQMAYHNQHDFIDQASDIVLRLKADAVNNALRRNTRAFRVYLAGNPDAANPIIYTQRAE